MAKRLKDLGKWQLVLLEDLANELTGTPEAPATPTRRTRRAAHSKSPASNAVKLVLGSETLEQGTVVELSADPEAADPKVAYMLLADLTLGIQSYVEIRAVPFWENSPTVLTAEWTSIQVKQIVRVVGEGFVPEKVTDKYGEKTVDLDYAKWLRLLLKDSQSALTYLAEQTLVIVSPKKARAAPKQAASRKRPNSYVTLDSDDEPSPSSSLPSESDSDPDLDESDSDHEAPARLPAKRQRSETPATPRKRNRESARGTEEFEKVVHVLLPFNKGFKVKSGLRATALPSVTSSARRLKSAEAFRELKEKLHTLTRIKQLPCREEQFEEVYASLESAVMEQAGCCVYVLGTPGVGKTATIREAIGMLRDNVQQGYVDDFDFVEINCLQLLAPAAAYERLWEFLSSIKVTPSNAALLLEEHFARGPARPLVVLMDELDQLVTKNQKVLYNFFNWPTYAQSKLIVVAVANTMDLPERVFSNKIASRLGLRRIQFKGYTELELGVVIAHRLTLMSEANKRRVHILDDAKRFASKKVALVSGDARRALNICRRAVELAELEYLASTDTRGVPTSEQQYAVRTEHIGMAIAETVNSPVARFLAALSFALKLVLVAVLLRMRRGGQAEVPLGDVWDEMRNTLRLVTSPESLHALQPVSARATYLLVVYGCGLVDADLLELRPHRAHYLVNELVELGVLTQQNIRSTRFRAVSLNIAEDDVAAVLRRDPAMLAML